jgi:hypothetical protein
MTGGPITDLDAWGAQVVADPPPLPDDDRFADWATQVTRPVEPGARLPVPASSHTPLRAVPEPVPLSARRARCVELSTTLLDHLERAAVVASGLADEIKASEPATPGVPIVLRGVVDDLRQIREAVLREQPGLVEAYSNALRREANR